MGILISPDGRLTLPCILFTLGVPLIAVGQYRSRNGPSHYPVQWLVGMALLLLGTAVIMIEAFVGGRCKDDLTFELPPREILGQLQSLESASSAPRDVDDNIKTEADGGKKNNAANGIEDSIRCLTALAAKCGEEQERRKKQHIDKAQSEEGNEGETSRYKPHEIEAICQDAAYTVLRMYRSDDTAASSAISLLALVAGDAEVRRRHIEEADIFGLDLPIRVIRDALSRAKLCESPAEAEERASAELQRKGCLFLGALADGDQDIAAKILDEEGLDAILDAIDWYRFESNVANWALWAIFILCYDNSMHKLELFKRLGIQRICRVMNDIPDSLEVARHGIAVLFDTMREVPESNISVARIRSAALSAGVQSVVKNAMENFPDSVEITMMGKQMLVATGFTGEIPPVAPLSS